ncbi:hypothetical protein [Halobacillus sp. KGW1]|uniref:hypothetical protein n=1 Tax=Halobacillus sp. KGW1 TaxID=1793726 RepID=UPI00078309F9|nr:hypothetical protein [Halobacillus sp. KGW1]
MNFLKGYLLALKNINKKRYLTPIPIFILSVTIYSHWNDWQRSGEYYDISGVTYTLMFPIHHWLVLLCFVCYPHAITWVQSTWLYRFIFRESSFFKQSGSTLLRLLDIERNTPDDYVVRTQTIRGADGRLYAGNYIASHPKGRRHRARSLHIYTVAFFIFKDIVLRYFTHGGVFIISPFLYIIAVPLLSRKGILRFMEQ